MKPLAPGPPKFPIGTVAAYGPDNRRATKVVAAVFKRPGQKEPLALHRWLIQVGDIRNDPVIAAEIAEFFKRHGVRHSAVTDRIIGCPHEEGIDYPLGGTCPHCPFWADIDRFTHQPKSPSVASAPLKPGRNDPCPCGSGKKYKKCCGASGAHPR